MEAIQYTHLIAELNIIGKKITDEYKLKLNTNDVWASGKLYNSIDYKIVNTKDGFQLVFLAEDYYINIENGRAAGLKMPPLNVIKTWIIEKGLPRTKGLDYIIARAISKNGIKPRPYLREIEQDLDKYTSRIEKAIIADMESLITNLTNNIKWQ